MSRLLNYLPWYERESEVFKEILRAEEIEFDKLELDLEDINKQFFVDTATWGLAIYEKELGLPIRPNKSLEERRSIIKAKWRGMGKVDYLMIKAIVEAFTSNLVTVEFDGRIKIVFTNKEKIRLSREMNNAINEVKPAHLGYDYIIKYIEELLLNIKTYSFDVPYKICNMFQTTEVPGGLMKAPIILESKVYAVDVLYPICNTFVTSQITVENNQINVILAKEYRDNEVLFKRVGSTFIGEGEI